MFTVFLKGWYFIILTNQCFDWEKTPTSTKFWQLIPRCCCSSLNYLSSYFKPIVNFSIPLLQMFLLGRGNQFFMVPLETYVPQSNSSVLEKSSTLQRFMVSDWSRGFWTITSDFSRHVNFTDSYKTINTSTFK